MRMLPLLWFFCADAVYGLYHSWINRLGLTRDRCQLPVTLLWGSFCKHSFCCELVSGTFVLLRGRRKGLAFAMTAVSSSLPSSSSCRTTGVTRSHMAVSLARLGGGGGDIMVKVVDYSKICNQNKCEISEVVNQKQPSQITRFNVCENFSSRSPGTKS